MSEPAQKPFLRPLKVILLTFLALMIYLGALLWTMPLGWVWHVVAGHLTLPPGVSVHQVEGRLWRGAVRVTAMGRDLRASWALQPVAWRERELPLHVTLESRASRLQGEASLRQDGGLSVVVRGQIGVMEFEDMIRQSGGALIEGDVLIDRLQLAWRDGRVQSATGLARWPGGQVSWPAGDHYQQADLPALQASLTEQAGTFALTIAQQSQPEPLAEAGVQLDGMMDLRVYKRLLDLVGVPWSDAASPGDVVFRVRQPLIPQGGF